MNTGRPGYWQAETSGVLRPAIESYLHGRLMTPEQIAAMRAYLRKWIMAPAWAPCEELRKLRASVDGLTTREAIHAWLDRADRIAIDPL